MKPLKPSEQLYWDRYLAGLSADERPQAPFVEAAYAGGVKSTDFLIDLYLKGRKNAGSSLAQDFLSAGEPLPKPGNFWIVLDSKNEPRLLLRTVATETHRFKDVPESVAQAEGEGDRSLAHWRNVHRRVFREDTERLGISDVDEADVITEHFEVLQADLIRKPTDHEMETVFLMGYDAWSNGERHDAYLKACRLTPKYRTGEWWVLEDRDGFLASSLLLHRFSDGAGIGSIATEPVRRRKGMAASLIRGVLCALDREGVERVYLYSDIEPKYYEQFGFKALPTAFQQKPGSVCMLRTKDFAGAISRPGFSPPPYF